MAPSNAYWTNFDPQTLTALTALVVAVGGLTMPYIKGWLDNKSGATIANAKREETAQERVERIASEQYKNIERERDYFAEKSRRAEAEADEAHADGVAMAEWAYYFRHYGSNAVMRFRALFGLFEQAGKGGMAPERVAVIAAEMRLRLPDDPAPAPLLRDATKAPPPTDSLNR